MTVSSRGTLECWSQSVCHDITKRRGRRSATAGAHAVALDLWPSRAARYAREILAAIGMTHPPREQSRILTWMCILIAVNQLGFGAVVATVALYARSFGVGQSAIGMAIASYGLARFLVAAPIGQLADGLGRRATLALGGLVTAAGNLLCAYAPTYGAFIAARFVAGAGAGLVLTSGQIILADITTPARRGRTMAIYQGVFLFAVGIGPLPGGVLAERFGLQAPFAVYAVGGACCALLAWLRIPETRNRRRPGELEPEPARPAFGAQFRLLAGKLGFVLVGVVSFMSAFARTAHCSA
jgi:MFS transporter, DHA1 family, multidrug resistance protein